MSKLAISNIAWQEYQDEYVYGLMERYGFSGLEIAPTRIFPDAPYDKLACVSDWANGLKKKYGFTVPSMQSIWFGREEKLFGTKEERDTLLNYTKKAIHFAVAAGCKNLVLGCPKNRMIPDGVDPEVAIHFFKEVGEYAYSKGTTIGIEANPLIYDTNYINDTAVALDVVEQVHSKGFLLNLDLGTMIQNGEAIDSLKGRVRYINHVHISEPRLRPIQKRELHRQLKDLLDTEGYQKFVSIEMGKVEDIETLRDCMEYVRGLING